MVDQFTTAAEAVGATVKQFSGMSGVVRYLQEVSGGEKVAFSHLPEEYAELHEIFPPVPPTEYPQVGFCLSVAQAGIAGTGSLLLDLSNTEERSATALAPIHLVLLKKSTILPDLRAAAPLLQSALTAGKSGYLSITTGPSRTADIERVLTIGVHGPKELHILILEGA